METSAQKLAKLAGIKESIRQAIVAKGFAISDNASFAEYAVALGGVAPLRNGDMTTTQDRLLYIENIKEAIRQAIISQEIEVPIDTPFSAYSNKILEIPIKKLEAFAIYSKDDNSLSFYKRDSVPNVGEQFEGKIATEVYNDIENVAFQYTKDVLWSSIRENVLSVTFVDEISPINMRLWFYGMSNCASMNFDRLDTSSVTDMSYMFHSCSSMTSFDLSKFDTSNVTSFNLMFAFCTSLASIVGIENWDVSNVEDMANIFSDCPSLKTANLSGWNTQSLITMSYMFLNCSNIEEIYMDNWTTSNVAKSFMLKSFYGCNKLQLIRLSENFEWHDTGEFFILPTPSNSNIPGADGKWYDLDTGVGYVPAEVPSNKAATYVAVMPKAFAVYSADDNSLSFYKRRTIPSQYSQFEGKTATQVYKNVETNSPSSTSNVPWSTYRTRITSVVCVDEVKPISMKYWFYEFKKCTSMDLTRLNTSAVTDMSYTFRYCEIIENLDFTGWDTSNVTTFKVMFENCKKLKTITGMNDWNVSKVRDMSNMFYQCESLLSIDLSGWNTQSLLTMGNMFIGCERIEKIDMSNWDTTNVTFMYRAFYECNRLKIVKLSAKFAWSDTGSNYSLPVPSSSYIPNADGKWYNSAGVGFSPSDIPNNVADTYYASKDLVP